MKEQMYISCGKKDDSSTQPLGDLGESPAFSRPLPTPEMQGVTDHVLTADEAMPNNIPDSQTTLNLFNSISLPAPQSPLRRNIQSPTASPLNGIIFQDPTALFTPPGSLDLPLPQTPVPLAPSQAALNAPPSVASSLSPIPSTSPQRALSHSASFSQTPIVLTSSHVAELHVPQEQGVIDSNHGGYRLRQRKPINLMPFKIDKAKYKRQLRSNPEAIVEFQSPSRRHRKAPQLMSSDVEPSDDREASLYSGNSDGERMRSRKGKERAHEEDGPLPGPSTQQSPVEGPRKWYPAAFDLMSSSGDEEFGDLPRLPKPVPPRKPKHRRLQPFPMKGILLHHSPAHGGAKVCLQKVV